MCLKGELFMCDAAMTSVNPETRDFWSWDQPEVPGMDESVLLEFTSHPEDDAIKRIPVLGPTRKQTELFFSGKQDKPCTADPIRRHRRDNLQGSPTRDVTSGNRPSSSYNVFNPQQSNTAGWLKQPTRPPKHSPALARPTAQSSKSVSMVTKNLTTRPTFLNYDGISKQGNSNSLLTHWPNSGYDTPPRYCVINSIGNANQNNALSRESSSSALRKSGSPVKDLINSKSSHSFVITADTSSLLVQSKSTFKSAPGSSSSAVGSRTRAKSAIQKVSEANYKSLVKSRSAQSRILQYRSKQNTYHDKSNSNTLPSYSNKTVEQHNSGRGNNLQISTTNPHTSQDNDDHADDILLSPHSSNLYLNRYNSDTSLHSKSQRKLKSGTKQGGQLSPRAVPVENYDQSFLVVQRASTQQQSFSKPHTPTKDLTSSPMAARRRAEFSSSNGASLPGNNKQTMPNKKGKDKTLTPSKHGYHPRSNSPTFKRLVAAVERLNETTVGKSPNSPSFRSAEDGGGDSVSTTDSHQGYRNFKDSYALNDVSDSDFTESDANSRSSDLRLPSKASRHSQNEFSGSSKNSKISGMGNRYPSDSRRSRDPKPAKASRDHLAIRNSSATRDNDFPPEEIRLPPTAGLLTTEDPDDEIGTYDAKVMKEPETRVQEGHPTQLHFFLPQLADSMSEVSGATATARSYYQDQRLELLSRNEDYCNGNEYENNATHPNAGSVSRSSKTQNGGGVGNGGDVHSKLYPRGNPSSEKSSVVGGAKCLPKQKHYPGQNGHGDKQLINGGGSFDRDRCLPKDLRSNGQWNQSHCNGRQSPNKDDTGKHKRYTSPARNKNCNIADKGARRKQLASSNNNGNNNNNNNSYTSSTTVAKPVVSYEHDFLDGQLPSEKLKKQIDNFPTLVSMEYSESPTPQQVR